MTDQTPLDETVEFDVPDDARELDPPEQTPYHTLLEVWRAVLKPARDGTARSQPVTPQWATKIVSTYPEVTFRQTVDVHHLMFDLIDSLGQILDDIIKDDDQSLTHASPQEDVENNSAHYIRVLTEWQTYMLREEMGWNPLDANASIFLAALSEVHGMFFGEKGLVAHLDAIGFQFTEDDQQNLQEALEATKQEVLGE